MNTYYTKITDIGAQKLARAIAEKVPLDISEMSVGDGGGRAIDPPKGTERKLVNEKFRAPINALYRNKADNSLALSELLIPSDQGGFYVRELGVWDTDGDMIAYGNFPDTYKPVQTEGATRDMTVRAGLKVGNASAVNLVIDTNFVGATREWVASVFAPLDSPEFIGAPTVPTPDAGDRSARAASTEWVGEVFAPLDSPEFTGNVKMPTPAAGDRSALAPTTKWVGDSFAPLDSPKFSGVPEVPTPAVGDISKQAPNTAWVVAYVESVAGGYEKDIGTVSAYVVVMNPPITTYTNGLPVKFRAAHANVGPCTLDAGPGPVPLLREDGKPMQTADIEQFMLVSCTYDLDANAFLVSTMVSSQLTAQGGGYNFAYQSGFIL